MKSEKRKAETHCPDAQRVRPTEAVESELGYCLNHVERTPYGTFRRQGFFIGLGVIEAGCKTVIGSRCKQSGRLWGKPGAEPILALRCAHSNRRLGEF
jgi:hypothetical protein